MLIYTLMFTLILPSPTQTVAYPIFVYSALLPWTYFSNAINSATNSIVGHSNLITKVYFPREILPLTYIGAALLDLLIATTVMAGLMLFYDVAITAQLLLVLPILIVLTLFVTAIALFLSAAQARVRDVGVAIALVLQLWMFASPVIYPLASVPERLRSWYVLNPMVGIIGNFRASVLGTGGYDWQAFSIATVASILLLPIAYIYFKRVELSVADVL
jgi:lipopolysaccharide transport system permease protein